MSEHEPNLPSDAKSTRSLVDQLWRKVRPHSKNILPEVRPEARLPLQHTESNVATYDPIGMLITAFVELRHNGISLGLRELLDAIRALEDGWKARDPSELKVMARLLWCKSLDEERELDTAWEAALATSRATTIHQHTTWPSINDEKTLQPPSREEPSSLPLLKGTDAEMQSPVPFWGMLPVKTIYTPTLLDDTSELHSYYPVSHRQMIYGWRYLRRIAPDGPQDVLDVKSTVEQAARQGFYLQPIYRRRDRNHARLVLLLDQQGSMVPFHRFTRDLEETARFESSIDFVDVFYFHNVPTNQVYITPLLSKPVDTEQMLAQVTADSSVLIVSDAGAARGHRQLDRIRASTQFLMRLKRQSSLVAWLNPMPIERWSGASAQVIAYQVPMFQMDPDGFSHAIDVVRGQQLSHYR